jgi:hypothetical protein
MPTRTLSRAISRPLRSNDKHTRPQVLRIRLSHRWRGTAALDAVRLVSAAVVPNMIAVTEAESRRTASGADMQGIPLLASVCMTQT